MTSFVIGLTSTKGRGRLLIGPGNTVTPALANLSTNFGLAPLIGKQLAVITDARLGYRTDGKVVTERLLSISGEDAITIDRKYKSEWGGMLSVRFLVLTNELPKLVDASGALASRFIPLILTRSFYRKEDLGLTPRLLGELSGILNWSLGGLERLEAQRHFILPERSQEAIGDLEGLSSPIITFIEEKCDQGPGLRASVVEVFEVWRTFSNESGIWPGSISIFGRNLQAAFPEIKKVRTKDKTGRRSHVYEGIALHKEVRSSLYGPKF